MSGRGYSYFDVPAEVFEAMRRSFSKGEYFNASVKKAGFAFEKVEG